MKSTEQHLFELELCKECPINSIVRCPHNCDVIKYASTHYEKCKDKYLLLNRSMKQTIDYIIQHLKRKDDMIVSTNHDVVVNDNLSIKSYKHNENLTRQI